VQINPGLWHRAQVTTSIFLEEAAVKLGLKSRAAATDAAKLAQMGRGASAALNVLIEGRLSKTEPKKSADWAVRLSQTNLYEVHALLEGLFWPHEPSSDGHS
jgi:hypothetical protein